MSKEEISRAIEAFCRAAMEKGDVGQSTSRDHALHEEMTKAVTTLRSFGTEGAVAFQLLLVHGSRYVRCWVAAELLATGVEAAKPVLEELASTPGSVGFDAVMVLLEHSAGRLGSPFGDGTT